MVGREVTARDLGRGAAAAGSTAAPLTRWWTAWCSRRLSDRLNVLPHTPHTCGRWPVWTRSCRRRCSDLRKDLSHPANSHCSLFRSTTTTSPATTIVMVVAIDGLGEK